MNPFHFLRNFAYGLLNKFIKKDKQSVFFIPHVNCKNDGYDVINYRSDNVLCLLNRMIRMPKFSDYTFYILIYKENDEERYAKYIRDAGFHGALVFVKYGDEKRLFSAISHASIIFTDEFYRRYPYKSRKQKVVCLGYYAAPFKDDYWRVSLKGYWMSLLYGLRRNKEYDNYITSSGFCSREISIDSQIYLPKFLPLGFPRNEIFYEDNTSIKNKICSAIGYTPKYIITYAPTHRDYEKKTSLLSDESLVHERTLFGNSSVEKEAMLVDLLEKIDAVIIAKVHPFQAKSHIINQSCQRIFFYSDFAEKCIVSLQEFLSVSDLLITDYSSTFYDYLLTRRPIIHYCYDYDIQQRIRGFAFDPILPFAAGNIVYTFDELCQSLKDIIEHNSFDNQKLEFVRSLIYLYDDNKSSERIIDYFFK